MLILCLGKGVRLSWDVEQFETDPTFNESSRKEEKELSEQEHSDWYKFFVKKYEYLKEKWPTFSDEVQAVEMKELSKGKQRRRKGEEDDDEDEYGGTTYVLADSSHRNLESGEEMEDVDLEEDEEEDGVYIGLLDGNVKKSEILDI